jgi:hypothetical protein
MEAVPTFSVVIPALNRGPKLLRAVGSAFARTLKDFETPLIDDGTEDSRALIYLVAHSWMSFGRSLPNRVRVVLRIPEAHH